MRPANAFDKTGIRSRHFKTKNSLVQIRARRQRYTSLRGQARFSDLAYFLKYFGHSNKCIKVLFVHNADQAVAFKNRRPGRVYSVHCRPGFSGVFLRSNNRYRLQETLPDFHQSIFSAADKWPKRGIVSIFKNFNFITLSLSNGCRAILLARLRTSVIKPFFDVTRFTNPKRYPSRASNLLPVSTKSFADGTKICRARRTVASPPGNTPNAVSGYPKTASSTATRISHESINTIPQPKADPFTAAMVGMDSSRRAVLHFSPNIMKRSACSFVWVALSLRSRPEEKDLPAPVTIRTLIPGVFSISSICRHMASINGVLNAFRVSGRFTIILAISDSTCVRRRSLFMFRRKEQRAYPLRDRLDVSWKLESLYSPVKTGFLFSLKAASASAKSLV